MDKLGLLQALNQYFNLEELQLICFDMGIEWENLAGVTKDAKAREIIRYVERRALMNELLQQLQEIRPSVQWDFKEDRIEDSEQAGDVAGDRVKGPYTGGDVTINIGGNVSGSIAVGEILEQSTTDEINYYLDREPTDTIPLHEAKMLLVGEGNVGKTSLVNRLIDNRFDPRESKTEGISIRRWQVPVPDNGHHVDIRLNVWDFGGQGIYQATHQFFFTRRSLYILVLNARQGERESRLEYWLKLIESFGLDAPIIVVVNKLDQQFLNLDERGLQNKYPTIAGFAYTSCVTCDGIDALREAIHQAIARLPHIYDELFVNWFAVKEKLEAMKRQRRDFVSYDLYIELCLQEGVETDIDQRTLIGFLHDLGVVLNFREDRRLEDTHVLNPEWVTHGVYQILTSEQVQHNGGVLALNQLDQILDQHVYPSRKHMFIVNMMRKFELCFPLPGNGDDFLIPDLLPNEEPALDWDYGDCLAFENHYNILPGSVITRFIVRMQGHIPAADGVYWRNGVVVEHEGNRALVKADREDKKIFIWVSGPLHTRRHLLSIIRAQLKDIHNSIAKLEVNEMVPLPEYPGQAITYRELRNLEEHGIERHFYARIGDYVDVQQLLNGIEMEQERQLTALRDKLLEHFDEDGLREICFQLPGIDYEDLSGDHRRSKARELVQQMDRIGRIPELLRVCRTLLPQADW